MTERPFGRLGDLVPVIGQGTWQMESTPREAVRALQRGLALGMRHIDTAEMYGSGRVEKIVGEALAGRRDQAFLVSKVLPANASYEGTIQACERSLAALGTDRLDVYLLHWPGDHPLEETFRAFRKLKEDGKIRAFGVSNFDVAEMEEAVAVVGAENVACNQVLYHLEERAIEAQLVPWCAERGIPIVAYSPFGSGSFPRRTTREGEVLDAIARKRGLTLRQVALAFLTRRPDVFAIPKASAIAHVEENAAAGDVTLTREEISKIDEAFPVRAKRRLPVI